MLIIIVLALAAVIDAFPTDSPRFSSKRKGPYKVYRIYPNSTDELQSCVELWKSASVYQVNFWKEPSRIGAPIDIMVPAHRQPLFEDLLSERRLDYIVTIRDVQKLIEERERPVSASKSHPEFRQLLRDEGDAGRNTERVPFFDFRRYHSYEDMRIYMRAIERRYPDWAKVYNLGFTHEGRPIEMIKIGYPLTGRGKKSVWIDAGIHAREWASSTTAMYFIHQLATKTGKDSQINQYVRELTWYITPVLNPDGYEFTRSSTDPEIRMWRKNRAPNTESCSSSTQRCCVGVDLNRNFDFHWGESGASDSPCEEIYQGSSPFSEPESRAVRDFILAHKNDIQAVITMHTYSQIWVHPFGHQRFSYPPDVDELRETGTKAVAALEKLYGTKYKVGSGADTLYPAAGGSDDWSKSKAGIKFVYLLELRPEENVWDGFILDADQILPTARETWEGVKVVVNNVLKRIGVDPISDDPNPAPNVDDSEPKQSPPFSSHRRASSRFEQRARIEGNDELSSTPDESDSSFSLSTTTDSSDDGQDIPTVSLAITHPPDDANFLSTTSSPITAPESWFGLPISASASETASTPTSASTQSTIVNSITIDGNTTPSTTTQSPTATFSTVPSASVSTSDSTTTLSVSTLNPDSTTTTSTSALATSLISATDFPKSLINFSSTSNSTVSSNIAILSNFSTTDFSSSSNNRITGLSLDFPTRLSPDYSTAGLSSGYSTRFSSDYTATGLSTGDSIRSSADYPSSTLSSNYQSTTSPGLSPDYVDPISNFSQTNISSENFESLDETHRRKFIYVKSNSSSQYRLRRKKPVSQVVETTNTSSSDGPCSDFMGELRCSRWVDLREGVCERLAHYMRQKCAKTCRFCVR